MTDTEREYLLTVLASVPERLGDLLACLDEHGFQYRHGPAFPTLGELVDHLAAAGVAADSLFRQIQQDQTPSAIRTVIDPPSAAGRGEAGPALQDLARIRLRTMDVLHGFAPTDWDRTVDDPERGPTSVEEICELVMRHEVGHLSQVRNLITLVPEHLNLGPLP